MVPVAKRNLQRELDWVCRRLVITSAIVFANLLWALWFSIDSMPFLFWFAMAICIVAHVPVIVEVSRLRRLLRIWDDYEAGR